MFTSLSRILNPLLRTVLVGTLTVSGLANPYQTPPKLDVGVEPKLRSALSIRKLLTEPLVSQMGEHLWVRTRDMRASFGPDGFTAFPSFGSGSKQEWPVGFAVDSITRGGDPFGTAIIAPPSERDQRVTLQRESVQEVYHLGLDVIEQTFVFSDLPGDGDLVVRMDVDTDLAVRDEGQGLRFVHDTFGEVRYGDAIVLDASGRRAAIERTWDGEHLTLTVPSAFLAAATLPVTIDPPVTAFINQFGADDDQFPDITYAAVPGRYFVCWEEYTSASNADVYMSMFSAGGAYISSFAVEITSTSWTTPRVAYSGAGNRLLVVATVVTLPPVFGPVTGNIYGRMLNASTQAAVGNVIQLHVVTDRTYQPDVGGTNRRDASDTHFLVAWTRVLSNGDRAIQYRVVEWTGSLSSPVADASLWPGERHFEPAVSESTGDHRLPGAAWTLVWNRDTGTDDLGQIWARRVRWNGPHTLGTGNFPVQESSFNSSPTVTSLLDDPLPGTNDRPAIVAWDTRWSAGGGTFQRSIYARIISDDTAFGYNPISSGREDFDGDLDQFDPSIATDGDGFVLSYAEGFWNNWSDYDMYMVSGHIATYGANFLVGLAERHQVMAFSGSPDHQGRVAMQQDGDHLSTNDDGACIWLRDLAGIGGELHGTTVDINTTDVVDEGSVGVQYCDANPNSVGGGGGRNASWLWIRGNQRFDRNHRAHCVDMPLDSFGYLLCSLDSGNVNMPAGSQGRLCLGGAIGRYTDQIASSGSAGEITTIIRPHTTPQPMGTVAIQVGETWSFQVWHRDVAGGQATSNFSNACRMTFTN